MMLENPFGALHTMPLQLCDAALFVGIPTQLPLNGEREPNGAAHASASK